jgi:myo-inositol-hexaphosphate 3-phosphohydrolase
VSDPANPLVFTPAGQESDEETTAYGITLYRSPQSGKFYAFVTHRDTSEIGQFELVDNGNGLVGWQPVRMITLPVPGGARNPQAEGMVADYELGVVYIAQEDVGIWKFNAEPDGGAEGTLIHPVAPDGDTLAADAEGLTIYYAAGGEGYLLASSQGDNRFSVYTREGDNAYLGSFLIGEDSEDGSSTEIDGVQESDGAQVINVPLGGSFSNGLFVVHDGGNKPYFIAVDEGEEVNVNTNFKFVPWEAVANAFTPPLVIDTTSYNPRMSQ